METQAKAKQRRAIFTHRIVKTEKRDAVPCWEEQGEMVTSVNRGWERKLGQGWKAGAQHGSTATLGPSLGALTLQGHDWQKGFPCAQSGGSHGLCDVLQEGHPKYVYHQERG